MVLEGQGTLGPASTCSTAEQTCTGQFNATLSGKLAQQVSSQTLQLDFEVYNEPLDTTGTLRKVRQLPEPLKRLEEQIQALKSEIRTLRAADGAAGGDDLPFGCHRAAGTGTFQGSAFTVGFEGRFCAFSSSQVELSGSVRIVEAPLSTDPETWGSGTLTASGALHTFSFGPGGAANPIPGSGPMVVSVVGAVGEVPGLFP